MMSRENAQVTTDTQHNVKHYFMFIALFVRYTKKTNKQNKNKKQNLTRLQPLQKALAQDLNKTHLHLLEW